MFILRQVFKSFVSSEMLNNKYDLHTFGITKYTIFLKLWPEEECPGFRQKASQLYESCAHLACRVLQAMAIGLELKASYPIIRLLINEDKSKKETLGRHLKKAQAGKIHKLLLLYIFS